MEVSKKFKEVRDVVIEIFESAGINAIEKEGDVFSLCSDIRGNIDELIQFYDHDRDQVERHQEKLSAAVSEVSDLSDLWKVFTIDITLGRSGEIGGGGSGNILSKFTQKFSSRDQMTEQLESTLCNEEISEYEKVDIALSIWLCAIEKAIDAADEDEVRDWVWGYGNFCGEYQSDISAIIENIAENVDLKETLMENFMNLILARFGMDIFEEGEYRSDEEGVLWGSIINDIVMDM